MCGIAGMVGAANAELVTKMTQMLSHRGPDEGGRWMDPGGKAGFGHRRLKILDLSPAARQPVASMNGRIILTFNGEIFNFPELRDILMSHGYQFRSHGDAEVLASAFEYWGDAVVDRLVGQFAFAAWDRGHERLFLARDHLGIKPLYVHEGEGTLSFASEAKSLLVAHPSTQRLRISALGHYLAFLWTPGPDTLFEGIQKVNPGSWMTWENGHVRRGEYWSPMSEIPDGPSSSASKSERADRLRELLSAAVYSQCASDVPLGVLLSGGLDSTIVLAEMRSALTRPEAFTAVYEAGERGSDVYEDDLPYARCAAEHLGASLHEARMGTDILPVLEQAIWHLDEPLADPTVVTNYQMMKAAKNHLTVVMSGMGADEVFGGYPRHRAALIGHRMRGMPTTPFRMAHHALGAVVRSGVLPLRHMRRPLHLLRHFGGPVMDQYLGLSSYFTPAELGTFLDPELAREAGASQIWDHHRAILKACGSGSPLQKARALDLRTFLPCLNLENMDKTSMAHAVEQRVPFLDHRLVTFALSLPDADLVSRGVQKRLLRDAYRGRIPKEILGRPKTGYSPPVRAWVQNALSQNIEDLLVSTSALGRGIWKKDTVVRYIQEHRKGKVDRSLRLWTLLVLELWFRGMLDHSIHPSSVIPTNLLEVSIPEDEGA